jgi:hypothetical protein
MNAQPGGVGAKSASQSASADRPLPKSLAKNATPTPTSERISLVRSVSPDG